LLVCLLVLLIQTLNFLQITLVAVSQHGQLVFALVLLLLQILVGLLCVGELVLQALNLGLSLLDGVLLAIQLHLQIAVLVSALVVDHHLLVDLRSQSLDEADVRVDPLCVFFFHQTLLLIQTREGLLKCQHLVLQGTVVSLLLS